MTELSRTEAVRLLRRFLWWRPEYGGEPRPFYGDVGPNAVAVPMVQIRVVGGATFYVRERPLSVEEFMGRERAAADWVETTSGHVRWDQVVEATAFFHHIDAAQARKLGWA